MVTNQRQGYTMLDNRPETE